MNNQTLVPQSKRWFDKLVVPAILVGGAGWLVFVLASAFATNGSFGFPLDDPWIHLQFARNVAEYGAFSYYKSEQITSGSTSPFYTLLLAGGFVFSSNEFVLSYAFGIAFLLVAVWIFSRLISQEFEQSLLLGSAGALLLLFEPRMIWSALSGMETTLFIAILLGVFLAYRKKSGVALGVASGLLVWTRPEGVLFLCCIALDALYQSRLHPAARRGGKPAPPSGEAGPWLLRPLLILLAFVLAYAAFNYFLSGSILPNTFAAKLKYYSGGGSEYPSDVLRFAGGGHMIVLAACVLAGFLETVLALLGRRTAHGLVPILWSLGLFIAYWVNLPHLYQEGRYLMPIIPFLLYLGIRGLTWIARVVIKVNSGRATATSLMAIVLLAVALQFAWATIGTKPRYVEYCEYVTDRQVKAANWIRANLPESAVIGTHDIGAIGFYSGRRIVDMVGLVSPDMIENIGSFDRLRKFLRDKGVTHLACLRNWFSVANQNPVFSTDPSRPEIMEVYTYDARRIHFMPQDVSDMVESARFALQSGQIDQAGGMLTRAIQLDPASSRTRYFLAKALTQIGKDDHALIEIENAIKIQNDYWDAWILKAGILERKGRASDAIRLLEEVAHRNPDFAESYRMLAQLYQNGGLDPEKRQYYLDQYARRSSIPLP
jgi:hypothetical protein